MWFEMDASTPYFSKGIIRLLKEKLNDRVIWRTVDGNWSPRPCALIPFDYSVHEKSGQQSIPELNDEIIHAMY